MDKRTIKTRNAITKAYTQALMSHPDRAVTVSEICRIADINKTTFYRNFNDIWDLYYKLIEQFVDYVITEDLFASLIANPREYFSALDDRLGKLSPDMLQFVTQSATDICIQIEKRTRGFLKERYGELDDVLLEFIFGALERGYFRAYGNKESVEKVILLADLIKENYVKALYPHAIA